MHWAFLSDTHISLDPADAYRGFQPTPNLKKVVAAIAEKRPQGALLCGDLARLEGKTGDYEAAKALLEPISSRFPLAVALGNHDDRKNFLSVFGAQQTGAQAVKAKHVLVIEGPAARLVVLDSMVQPNSTPGFLGKVQREWLGGYLRSCSDLPTLIFVHHTLSDDDGALLDAPRLFDLVRGVKKVKAIVYGHSHNSAYAEWEGIHLINIPSTAYNFRDSEPLGWLEARLTREAGSFTLHAIDGNRANDGRTVRLTWRT